MTSDASTHGAPLPLALRDTALTVATLVHEGAPRSFSEFRQKCNGQIERLRAELTGAGHPRDVVEDAAYAQCALLDEAALGALKGSDRDAWEREPLQVIEFQSHDAGQELIARIERRLVQEPPALPLLAIFSAVLSLGFTGKFALGGQDARMALIRAVDERLDRSVGRVRTTGSVIVKHSTRRRWFDNLSPVAWIVIACAVAAIIYIVIDQWLIASINRITH